MRYEENETKLKLKNEIKFKVQLVCMTFFDRH